MLSIIYPYRNRELERIKRSLESLVNQTKQDFKVHFIDYGSNPDLAREVEALVTSYAFADYQYVYNIHQPWNKCKALNFIIKSLQSSYFFVSDVDMLFHKQFVETALSLAKPDRAVYFQVGMLTEEETNKGLPFEDCQINFKTDETATGMTIFPVDTVKELRGFDEFYHFWGSEDTDMHERIKNYGLQINYYNRAVLMLHQWHKTYRMKETNRLTEKLQLIGVVQLNHQHLMYAISKKRKRVNGNVWGMCMNKEDLMELENPENKVDLINEKKIIDHWLFVELKSLNQGTYRFKVNMAPVQKSLKYHVKRVLRKKVPVFYSLKQVNDMLLTHIISYLKDYPYTFKVNNDLNAIEFCISIK